METQNISFNPPHENYPECEYQDPLFGLDNSIVLEMYDTHFLAFDVLNCCAQTFLLPLNFESLLSYSQLLNNHNMLKMNQLNVLVQDFQKKNFILNSFINDIASNNIKRHNDLIAISRGIINNEVLPLKYVKNYVPTNFIEILNNQMDINLKFIRCQLQLPINIQLLSQQFAQKRIEQEKYEQEQSLLQQQYIQEYIQVNNFVKKDYVLENKEESNEPNFKDDVSLSHLSAQSACKDDFSIKNNTEPSSQSILTNQINHDNYYLSDDDEEVKKYESNFGSESNDFAENLVIEKLNEDSLNHLSTESNDSFEKDENNKSESVPKRDTKNYWLNKKNTVSLNKIEEKNIPKYEIIENKIFTNKEAEFNIELPMYIFDDNLINYHNKLLDSLTYIKFDIIHQSYNSRFNDRLKKLKKLLSSNIQNIQKFKNLNFNNFRIHIYTEKPQRMVHDLDYISNDENILSFEYTNRVKNGIENKTEDQIELIKYIFNYRTQNRCNNLKPYILHFSNQSVKILKNRINSITNWIQSNKNLYNYDNYEDEKKTVFRMCVHLKNNTSSMYPHFFDMIFNTNTILAGDLILIWY